LGIIILVIDVQLLKQLSPNEVTEFGIVKLLSLLQLKKALYPILVRVSGKTILVIFTALLNPVYEILVTLYVVPLFVALDGIVILPEIVDAL
jgi:hypothetical protein